MSKSFFANPEVRAFIRGWIEGYRQLMNMQEDYDLLLTCYRSGQISEKQWQEHLSDEGLREYIGQPEIKGGENY